MHGWLLGLIISLQDPTPFSPFAPEDWKEGIRQLRAAGYDGVELAITNPAGISSDATGEVLKREGLRLLSITTGQAAVKEGLSLSSPDEKIRRQAVERIQLQMQFARPFGAVVIVGALRGADGDIELLVESLRECAIYDPGVKIALEPLNRYESCLINTTTEGLKIIEEIKADNLGLLLDTFHANIEEREIDQALRDAGEKLFHIHLADSNRWPPSYGHIDFDKVWKTLVEINYQGGLTIESFPLPGKEKLLSSAKAIRARWNF